MGRASQAKANIAACLALITLPVGFEYTILDDLSGMAQLRVNAHAADDDDDKDDEDEEEEEEEEDDADADAESDGPQLNQV